MRDPQFLHNLIKGIISKLFEKEESFSRKQELALLSDHRSLCGPCDGFRYRGTIHTDLVGRGVSRGAYTPLHSSLCKSMDGILDERAQLESEKTWVRQALYLILKNCTNWQDIRDALPNELISMVPQCAPLFRTREEAFTIKNDQRALLQYRRLKEKIEFYAATQLIY